MKSEIEQRAVTLAKFITEQQTTVRVAARYFGVSKSTVHKDLTQRLPAISRTLYESVQEVLQRNKAERHIRGGLATRAKYRSESQSQNLNHNESA